jgi:thiamine-phosphate diphosphorylase
LDLDLRLLAIADVAILTPDRVAELAVAAVRGGATSVQLRGKEIAAGELVAIADAVRANLEELGVPWFINDRVDVARLVEATGVHLGDEDLSIGDARALLGPQAVIGRTARTPESARDAAAAGADYLGVGTVYSGGSKPGVPVIGVDGLRSVARVSPVPVIAIGGIHSGNAAACIEAGAAGVAVIGALFAGAPGALEVEARAGKLRAAIEGASGARGGHEC